MRFLTKNFMMTTKKNIYLIDFFFQIEILLLNIFKLFKIPNFLFKIPDFSMLKTKSLIPGFFLSVPGKVATLMIF